MGFGCPKLQPDHWLLLKSARLGGPISPPSLCNISLNNSDIIFALVWHLISALIVAVNLGLGIWMTGTSRRTMMIMKMVYM